MDEVSEREVPLSLDVVREQAIVTVRASGEIDMATAGALEDALLAELHASPTVLIVDLEPVTFLASMGLSVLARANQAAREAGTEMRVVASSRFIVRTLELSGMLEELTLFPGYPDAVVGQQGSARRSD